MCGRVSCSIAEKRNLESSLAGIISSVRLYDRSFWKLPFNQSAILKKNRFVRSWTWPFGALLDFETAKAECDLPTSWKWWSSPWRFKSASAGQRDLKVFLACTKNYVDSVRQCENWKTKNMRWKLITCCLMILCTHCTFVSIMRLLSVRTLLPEQISTVKLARSHLGSSWPVASLLSWSTAHGSYNQMVKMVVPLSSQALADMPGLCLAALHSWDRERREEEGQCSNH